MSGQQLGRWVVAGLGLMLALVGAARGMSGIEWIGEFETAHWTVPGPDPAQSHFRAAARFALGERWSASAELFAARSADGEAHLGPRLTAAASVAYQRSPRWLLQMAAATPGGMGALGTAQRELARSVGEPLLRARDPEPARGWRWQADVVYGRPVTRRLALLLAVSGEVAGTFEAAPGIRLDPADRLRLDLTLDLRLAQTRAWLQTRFTAEGETRLAGDRLRSRRRMLSGCVGAELPWAGSRFTVVGELARTGQVTLSDAWEYGVWREAGPAMIAALGLRATPPGRWEIGRGGALVGDLGLGWRRVLPEGLPYADGWAVEVTPRVRWLQGTRTYGLTLAWIRGHASGGFGGGAGDVRGWRFGIEVAWIGERAPLLPFAAEGEEP